MMFWDEIGFWSLLLTVLCSGCGSEGSRCQDTRSCNDAGAAGEGAGGEGAGGEGGEGAIGPSATAGEAGAGEAGAGSVVEEGEDCSAEQALACPEAGADRVLRCDGGVWVVDRRCAEGSGCDPENPACRAIVDECQGLSAGESFCDGTTRRECGPGGLSTLDEPCQGLCVEGACVPASCGDGVVQDGEDCDDANDDDTDECLSSCVEASCGDGHVWFGEEDCDDGNDDDNDGCPSSCEEATCGDGFVWFGEEDCDDGNDDDNDACLSDCTEASCGDGFVWEDEETCDDQDDDDTDECLSTCEVASCGDGFLQREVEVCDDGNAESGDGCSDACRFEPVELALGADSSCALFADGRIKCWGDDSFGQLGIGSTAPGEARGDEARELGASLSEVDLPGAEFDSIAGGENHYCAVTGGDLFCWGDQSDGQLGVGGTDFHGSPAAVNVGGPVAMTGLGRVLSCALLQSGEVKCWSSSPVTLISPIGDGTDILTMGNNLEAFDLGGARALSLALGPEGIGGFGCVVEEGGFLACFGQNDSGQIGVERSATAVFDSPLPEVDLGSDFEVSAAALGREHSCALSTQGDLKCWGDNAFGQLGRGDSEDVGGNEGDMGDALEPVELGQRARAVAAGGDVTCVILDDGKVKCWGAGASGVLGQPEMISIANPNLGDNADELPESLPVIDLGTGLSARRIMVGGAHACALLSSGEVKCWGENEHGELGLGDNDDRGDDPGEMGDALDPAAIGD